VFSGAFWASLVVLFGATVQAQDNPELGVDGEVEAEGEASLGSDDSSSSWSDSSSLASGSGGSDDASSDSDGDSDAALGGSDHDKVVGRLGVGFFGMLEIPIMVCQDAPGGCANPAIDDVSAPTIGARYWLDTGFGAELAAGFNITSPSQETETSAGGTTTTTLNTTEASVVAFGVHGGLPLVFAHSGHFVFEAVPQLNIGIASGSHDVVVAGGTESFDVSGLLIEAALKAGAEIHFGFIDIPQLSLQATLGVGLRIESRSAEGPNAAGGTTTHSQSRTRIATGVDDAPWEIFTGALTAIYYL
jgi:hypothetical protein